VSDAPGRPLRRSLFFVPGSESRKLDKAPGLGADTLLLDLEDSVALPDKDRARGQVAAFLAAGEFGGAEAAVRVNPPGTPYFEDDIEAAVGSGAAAIMIPKSARAQDLEGIALRIQGLERSRQGGDRGPVRLLALVETAAGLMGAGELAACVRVDALCFGHADFSRDMGLAGPDPASGVLLHARCSLAIVAHACDIAAVDTVFLDVRDDDGFRQDARLGASLGFEGKLCIHPRQVGIANEVHTPDAQEVAYALRIREAAREAREQGKGVFTVDGKMVDAPLIAAQERVLERAQRAGIEVAGEA
jgi:citrate lyase subunit beta/citryl-CoA lyase